MNQGTHTGQDCYKQLLDTLSNPGSRHQRTARMARQNVGTVQAGAAAFVSVDTAHAGVHTAMLSHTLPCCCPYCCVVVVIHRIHAVQAGSAGSEIIYQLREAAANREQFDEQLSKLGFYSLVESSAQEEEDDGWS